MRRFLIVLACLATLGVFGLTVYVWQVLRSPRTVYVAKGRDAATVAREDSARTAQEETRLRARYGPQLWALHEAHPDWPLEDCQRVWMRQVWIGMSIRMLVYERGAPDHQNVSNYGGGDQYQYCWDRYVPSCFYDRNADGIIDAYN